MVFAAVLQGCVDNKTGRIDVTVEIDPAIIGLESVLFHASADGRMTSIDKEVPASGATSLKFTVIVRDPGPMMVVTLLASGKQGREVVVSYGALARVSAGEVVNALLRLSAKCEHKPKCDDANQICDEGSCVDRPTFGGGPTTDAAVDVTRDTGPPPADRPASVDSAGDRPAAVDSGCDGGASGCGVDATPPACLDRATRLCKDDPDLKALGNCGGGVEMCTSGHWGACSVVPASTDSCALIGDDATCDGKPNEGCPCVAGDQQPCGPAADVGICKRGTQTCTGGAWGACTGAIYAAARDCTSAADNNCDGAPDNTLDTVCVCAATTTRPCDEHAGKDGRGRCKAGTQTCVVATDRKTSAWGTCTGSVGPAAADACTTGNDDNCNGIANEGCTCVEATTQACGPAAAVGICKKGSQTCTGAAWGACVGAVFAAARDCTSTLDNDCDGLPDNTIDAVCGCASGATQACGQHPGQDGKGPCKAGSQTCVVAADKKSSVWGACSGSVGPKPADGCDPTNDDNCNGVLHEGCTCVNGTTRSCGPAAIGICKPGTQTCANATWPTACPGAVTAQPRDCTSPADNDCNGLPDNTIDAVCGCASSATQACGQHPGQDGKGPCKAGSQTCVVAADKKSSVWGACSGSVGPAARNCASTIDNDCGGLPDNQDSTCVCPAGTTGPCPGNNTGSCRSGTRTCILSADMASTTWGTTCVGQVLPAAADTCTSGNDANCNGSPNDGCQCLIDKPPVPCPCGAQACTNGKLGACVTTCTGTQTCSNNMCVCQPKSSTNLLTNPGFDGSAVFPWVLSTDPSSSTPFTSYDGTTDLAACTGSGSVHVEGLVGNFHQCQFIANPTTVYFGFHFKGGGSAFGAWGFCGISFYTDLSCTTLSQTPGADAEGLAPLSGAWGSGSGSANPTSDVISVMISCSAPGPSGWYDDLYVTQSPNTGY